MGREPQNESDPMLPTRRIAGEVDIAASGAFVRSTQDHLQTLPALAALGYHAFVEGDAGHCAARLGGHGRYPLCGVLVDDDTHAIWAEALAEAEHETGRHDGFEPTLAARCPVCAEIVR